MVGGMTATEVRAMASAASREAGDMEAREAAAVIEELRPQAVEAEAGAVVEAVAEAAAEAAGEVARMAAAASRATEMEAREALGAVTATRAIQAVYRAAAARSSWHLSKRLPDAATRAAFWDEIARMRPHNSEIGPVLQLTVTHTTFIRTFINDKNEHIFFWVTS